MKQTREYKSTKLMQAVYDYDLTKVKSLIKDAKKFSVKEEMFKIPDKDEWTPLMSASQDNNLLLVKLLNEAGTLKNKKNNIGRTAAHVAAEYDGSNDVLRIYSSEVSNLMKGNTIISLFFIRQLQATVILKLKCC